MRVTMHNAVATRSLPVTVEYTCQHCGTKNVDSQQYLKVTRSSRVSLLEATPGMQNAAGKRADSAFLSMTEDIRRKKFRKANLTCKCKKCGKRQSWSSFLFKPYIFLIMAFVIGCVFLISLLMNLKSMPQDSLIKMAVFTSVLILPLPVIHIINLIKDYFVSKTDEQYLPRITERIENPSSGEE